MDDHERSRTTISGWMVNLVLRGLSKTAGPLYDQWVEQTPWLRFKLSPPADDPAVLVTDSHELALVFSRIYTLAGRDLYVAFVRQAGREAGITYAARLVPRLKPALGQRTGLERLQRAAALHTVSYRQQGAVLKLTSQANGGYLTYQNCPECLYLHSDEPLCYFIAEASRQLLSQLTDYRVDVRETRCRAVVGGSECDFTFRLR